MKFLRWGLGALVTAYALLSAVTVVGVAAAYKLGAMKIEGPDLVRLEPWLKDVAWWELGLGALQVAALLAVAWRLFTGGRALLLFAVAFLLDLATWLAMRGGEGYQAAFTAEEQSADYVIFGILLVVGALIWLTERKRG